MKERSFGERNNMKIVGLDIGTTTISAVVFDGEKKEVVKSRTVSNEFFINTENEWEKIQDADGIVQKAKGTLDELLSEYADTGVIGLTGQMHGIVYTDGGQERGIEVKNACLEMFDYLKSVKKDERIFHVTGLERLESCVDGFKMINKTARYMEKVFPYKRVFSKYEISMVSDCVYMQSGSQMQRKMYLDLLEPFEREVSQNKGRMLVDTLSTFVLDAGMNSGRTAEFLEIHNNTVQYRLKKANEILGAEMTANRVIPGLTLALALKRLEEEN